MRSKIRTLAIATIMSVASTSALAYDEPFCREYTETFQIGGRTQQGYGTACLQPDGSWEKQDSNSYDVAYEQRKQNVVYVIDRRPVQIYQPYRPFYRPYPTYYSQPSTFLSFNFGNTGYRPHRYYGHNNYYIYNNNRGHGHGNHRGNGHGHGHH